MEPLAVEQQDSVLLQLIRAADPDPLAYRHLCNLLNEGLESGVIPLTTPMPAVDFLGYRLMGTADKTIVKLLVTSGLHLCFQLAREGLFDALSDAVRILLQHGAAALRVDAATDATSSSRPRAPLAFDLPPSELHELFFWEHVVRVHLASKSHMLSVARTG